MDRHEGGREGGEGGRKVGKEGRREKEGEGGEGGEGGREGGRRRSEGGGEKREGRKEEGREMRMEKGTVQVSQICKSITLTPSRCIRKRLALSPASKGVWSIRVTSLTPARTMFLLTSEPSPQSPTTSTQLALNLHTHI